MSFPMMRDPEAMLTYAMDWLHDANDRWDLGHKAHAAESLRSAAQIYVQMPQGYNSPEFEELYQQTTKKIYGGV